MNWTGTADLQTIQCTSCFHSPPNFHPDFDWSVLLVSMHFVLSFPSEHYDEKSIIFFDVFQCTSCFHSPPNPLVSDHCRERDAAFQCTSCFHSPPNFYLPGLIHPPFFCFNALRAFIPLRTGVDSVGRCDKFYMFQCTSCFHSPPNIIKRWSRAAKTASFNALRAFIPLRTLPWMIEV